MDIKDVIKGFEKPDRKYSAVAFWFWNGELNPDFLAWQIDEMVDKGVYGGFMHARAYLKTPYLENDWWKAVDKCVARGREKGFNPWIYDEYAWPSGTAGSTFEFGYQKPSRVLAEGEKNMAKGLYARKYAAGEPIDEENLLAKFPTDNGGTLAFYRRVYLKSVDYLNKDAIRVFINCTHEEYKKRYESDFGTTIPGVFFDEIYMIGYPLPWTDSLPDEFLARCGYDLMKELPCLLEGEDDHARKVRRDYYRVISELYEEAFFKQISEWCTENNLMLTGHTEEYLQSHPRRQGNFFNTMRHLHIPGADNHDYRYRFPRKITFCEPKYAVSVARAYNRERCMSEAMGGAGWGCSLQEFKRGINTMGAMGINMFTLHGFYNECEHQGSQADWPTSFFYQNPYWKYFKNFGDYISRICYMNTIGRPVVDNALYYPINELYEDMVQGEANERGKIMCQDFDRALNILLCRQMDTDMIDYESLARANIKEGKIEVGQQSFSALICPANMKIDEILAEKLRNFVETGGHLIFYSSNPGEAAPKPFGEYTVYKPESLPEVLRNRFTPDVQVIEGDNTDLYVNHRVVGDLHYYMISNSTNKKRQVTLQLRQVGNVIRMDPETGKTMPVKSCSKDGGTRVVINLEADEACYLLFYKKVVLQDNEAILQDKEAILQDKEAIPPTEDMAMKVSSIQPITGHWSFIPLSKEYDSRWGVNSNYCMMDIPIAVFSSESGGQSQLIRICNKEGELGKCGRHLSEWKASWITRRPSWCDDADATDLYFRKVLWLDSDAIQARLCIVAVNNFTLYVNGQKVCSHISNRNPIEVDIAKYLQKGKNLMAVHVHNHIPLPGKNVCEDETLPPERIISLLLEGTILTANQQQIIKSDGSWIVCRTPGDDWYKIDIDIEANARHLDPKTCTSFGKGAPDHVWLYAWERGRPPIQPWGNIPLFGNDVKLPQQIAYTITLPAGTVLIEKPEVRGKFNCLLDGLPISFDKGAVILENDGVVRTLVIQVTAESLDDGLLKPIRVMVKPHNVLLGDWRMEGLKWFSGRALYHKEFTLEKQSNCRYWLDLGDVRFNAEIWVNKKLVGTRIWEPYRIEITDALVDGINELDIVVANSAAVERQFMLVDEGVALGWNRYWNEDNIYREPQNLVSGLQGPVQLYVCTFNDW
ncbi:MAG TPA: hypothetical protein GXX37_15570 [Clostridiaceae bacterium]|nr:hypothetical protein [Clostridiaceae bacterium]